jgi:DNA-binding winged helix-turn-helix (wHTH) protein
VIYRFEDISLDTDKRHLRIGRELVDLEPLGFDVLEFLIRNRQRVVSKDDLIAEVWNGYAVSDSTISSRLSLVRQALRDDGRQQRLIQTISRKGFRFVADIESEFPTIVLIPNFRRRGNSLQKRHRKLHTRQTHRGGAPLRARKL